MTDPNIAELRALARAAYQPAPPLDGRDKDDGKYKNWLACQKRFDDAARAHFPWLLDRAERAEQAERERDTMYERMVAALRSRDRRKAEADQRVADAERERDALREALERMAHAYLDDALTIARAALTTGPARDGGE